MAKIIQQGLKGYWMSSMKEKGDSLHTSDRNLLITESGINLESTTRESRRVRMHGGSSFSSQTQFQSHIPMQEQIRTTVRMSWQRTEFKPNS